MKKLLTILTIITISQPLLACPVSEGKLDFKDVDTNNDQQISAEELRIGLAPFFVADDELETMVGNYLKYHNDNGDEYITIDEWPAPEKTEEEK